MIARRVGAWGRRLVARWLVKRALDLHVVGLEHVPSTGPVLLVARHYHHLYDAAAIIACVQREVHIVIALDWLPGQSSVRLMRWLAAAAEWPVVWRRGPRWRLNRAGYRLSVDVLGRDRVLLIFPQGYPTIDLPAFQTTPNQTAEETGGPFDPGFLVLAERRGAAVAVVPVGLSYTRRPGGRWTVWIRFGSPVANGPRPARLAAVESEIRRLSSPPVG